MEHNLVSSLSGVIYFWQSNLPYFSQSHFLKPSDPCVWAVGPLADPEWGCPLGTEDPLGALRAFSGVRVRPQQREGPPPVAHSSRP